MADTLFDILAKEHVTVDWGTRMRKLVDDGRMRYVHNPLEHDFENKKYDGLLLVANGPTMVPELQRSGIILDVRMKESFDVPTHANLMDRIADLRERDGGLFYDSENQKLHHAHWLGNGGAGYDPIMYVPEDFTAFDCSRNPDSFGNRTYVASKSPHLRHCESYLIRQTPYTPLGMGKLVHFDEKGLRREFFLAHAPFVGGEDAPRLDQEKNVVGVYRVYDLAQRSSIASRQEYFVDMDNLLKGVTLLDGRTTPSRNQYVERMPYAPAHINA